MRLRLLSGYRIHAQSLKVCSHGGIQRYSLLTPRSWVLGKLPVVELVKNFPTFYGTPRFITVFTRALHWSLSWARSVQSITPHHIPLRSILLLCSHLRLGLPSGLFPFGSPTNILYAWWLGHIERMEDNAMLKWMLKGRLYSKRRKARRCWEWPEEDEGERMEREDEK
jgi:hypothetical protein